MQQPNPWEPWPAWPDVLPAQQVAQQHLGQDLNNLLVQIEIDLNEPAVFDPLKVIIHPTIPPPMDLLELNDLIAEVEEHIPQPQV